MICFIGIVYCTVIPIKRKYENLVINEKREFDVSSRRFFMLSDT